MIVTQANFARSVRLGGVWSGELGVRQDSGGSPGGVWTVECGVRQELEVWQDSVGRPGLAR